MLYRNIGFSYSVRIILFIDVEEQPMTLHAHRVVVVTGGVGKLEGAIQGEYGSYNHFVGRAKGDFPVLTDADGNSILAAHLSFLENEGGNWILDTLTNNRNQGGWNDQNFRPSSTLIGLPAVATSRGSGAPWVIHVSRSAIAAADSLPLGGIFRSPS